MGSDRASHTASGVDAEAAIVQSFGYRQELNRALSAFASYAVAFSVISITTGIFTNFGLAIGAAGPVGIWTWVIVGLGQILVGMVLAELAGRIPLAGAGYVWSSRLANPQFGWFIGFSGWGYGAFAQVVINMAIATIILTILSVEASLVLIAAITTVLFVIELIINIVGVRLLTTINNIAVVTEIAGGVGIAVILLVLMLAKPINPPGFLFQGSGPNGSFAPGGFLIAFLLGLFTLVGFEAAANLGEETKAAHLSVPKAINFSIISSVVLGMIMLIGFALAIPDLEATAKAPNALAYVIENHFGQIGALLALLVVLYSMFACMLIGMASMARMVYAMGRDNMLPRSDLWREVSSRWRTPVKALVIVIVIDLILTWWAATFAQSYTFFAGMAAVLPFLTSWTLLIAYLWRRDKLPKQAGAFDMGGWSRVVNVLAILWQTAALLILTVPEEFHMNAVATVVVIALCVALYYAFLRPKLQRGEAGPGKGFMEEAQPELG